MLLVGTELQHVIAQLALEVAEATAPYVGSQLKLRDDLFWFGKPRVLWWLIQFISFQVMFIACYSGYFDAYMNIFSLILTLFISSRMPLSWQHSYGLW